ncbi:hypothetical protein GCK72_011569 [Caenorhabditis remanei]|uniref:Uncharacterized protein n=1 Tax=Caenorhabditis remanei TaxID=31234 RepID=A0A6A5HA44_CAERE|nr:hypothetical protein GCK72_011569 [Caenorhabditis remanei]KAF1763303.1 hypothetical protein GCK72_011569 [Caenorhabditis remanei]
MNTTKLEKIMGKPLDYTIKCHSISASDFKLCANSNGGILLTWCAVTDTNTLTDIIRELSEIVRVKGIGFYLLDQRDVLRIQKQILGTCPGEREKNEAMLIYMRNLTDFSKNCQKVLYLRTMMPAAGETARRVFKEEALEIILIILIRQKPDESKRKLEERLNKYKGGSGSNKNIHQTMDLNEFIAILEEHEVPKDQITLVENPLELVDQLEYERDGNHIGFPGPNCDVVLSISAAIWRVFKELVCGIMWRYGTLDGEEELRKKILELMKEFLEMGPGIYISLSYILTETNFIRGNRSVRSIFHASTISTASCTFSYYEQIAKVYHLPVFGNFLETTSETLPTWMMRILYAIGVIQVFFKAEPNKELENILLENLTTFAPRLETVKVKEFLDTIIQSPEGVHAYKFERADPPPTLEELEKELKEALDRDPNPPKPAAAAGPKRSWLCGIFGGSRS